MSNTCANGGLRTSGTFFLTTAVAVIALSSQAGAQAKLGTERDEVYDARLARILKATPLIDGHNDWPEALRDQEGDGRWTLDLRKELDRKPTPYNTDIARLRQGKVGGQFWSVFVSPDLTSLEQVKETIEQIDHVKSLVARYPDDFAMARTA